MRLRFWGTRGSLPVALTAAEVREKVVGALLAARGRSLETPGQIRAFVEDQLPFSVGGTFGGHSPCVQIDTGASDEYLLCDAGSGIRPFGQQTLRERKGRPGTYHVLVSHMHWDHIMGFPFFTPAYIPGNTVHVYGCHAGLEGAFRRQQDEPSFPVPLSVLKSDIRFTRLVPGESCTIAGCTVVPRLQHHGGDSYGYRIEHGGKCVVYTTDTEHKMDQLAQTQAFIEFFREADAVVFDSMYSLAEAMSVKEDWGHSSNVVGVELCQLAKAKRLCLFHHEPVFGDERLEEILAETRRFEEITRDGHTVEVLSAYDGLELEI
ncbi:MAG TPA: MBL fold metallo-hydrolase [Verrucomicrobiae bacterium]|nr:MBL fold metallo-hydrolase [Verrucomicrobiae bacterium]